LELEFDRGVCDGDIDTIPTLLCVESIALLYFSTPKPLLNRSESLRILHYRIISVYEKIYKKEIKCGKNVKLGNIIGGDRATLFLNLR